MNAETVVVAGGGAAGFFAAITCAETRPGRTVHLIERGREFLSKVRISGGGRCNVTHACFEERELASRYPRGGRALIGPFRHFQPRHTMAWFERRGVPLKIEADGRVFPASDSSQAIIDCLIRAARDAGVQLRTGSGIEHVARDGPGRFVLTLSDGSTLACEKLLLATGGCRAAAAGRLATSLGHTLEPPVPSLFTFQIEAPWLRALAGVSVENVTVSVPELRLREQGALLVTHWGLSGPVILRMSAWGARALHRVDYRVRLLVNWLPQLDALSIERELRRRREQHPARWTVNVPVSPLPARLWEALVLQSGIAAKTRWADLSRGFSHRLTGQLTRTELSVTGKSLNKDEFVTCGGVRLGEVNMRTMESRICRGLHLAGEILDIDGLTGGYNFQAAWTTGWLAGQAMAS